MAEAPPSGSGPQGPPPPVPPPHGQPPYQYPPYPLPPPQPWPPRRENTLAIAGLVCSLLGITGLLMIMLSLGIFFFIGVLTLPLVIAGMVLGVLGKQKVDRGELETGRGMAQAAFIIGLIGVVLHALGIVLAILAVGFFVELFSEFGELDFSELDQGRGDGDRSGSEDRGRRDGGGSGADGHDRGGERPDPRAERRR